MDALALALYRRQVAEQRRIRDRLLDGLADADARWQPGPDLPCATWHLLHAAFTNTATFLGQGDDDWPPVEPRGRIVMVRHVRGGGEVGLEGSRPRRARPTVHDRAVKLIHHPG